MSSQVITIGIEPDPAKRLRQKQGARIKDLRKLHGLSMDALAERMCEQDGITVTQQAISQWENGQTTARPHMQVALARALRVTPSNIFGLDVEIAA